MKLNTRKGKALGGRKLKSAWKADERKTERYMERAKENQKKQGKKVLASAALAAQGDFYGAGKKLGQAAVGTIGKKNIKQAGKALLSKQDYRAVSKMGKKAARADRFKSKVEEGDVIGAGKMIQPKSTMASSKSTQPMSEAQTKVLKNLERANSLLTKAQTLHAVTMPQPSGPDFTRKKI